MSQEHRIVEPIIGWQSLNSSSRWGDNTLFIEGWFDEGEALAGSGRDVIIDEPHVWERAAQWFRSLAVATRLLPA